MGNAFWSRVTPPELLYIWLLSFDELRLPMNAHLPVVRPLLCYARRGATPMHQKKKGGKSKLKVICGGKEIDKKPITMLLSVGLRRDCRRPKRL